eukprot:796597-Alexandrium_andersonii.AAC.1
MPLTPLRKLLVPRRVFQSMFGSDTFGPTLLLRAWPSSWRTSTAMRAHLNGIRVSLRGLSRFRTKGRPCRSS